VADKRGEEKGVLRVPATLEDIKKSYGKISRVYATLEGRFERAARKKGLRLLAVKDGEVTLEIGIGTGFSLKEIASSVGEHGKAYGIDITPEMVRMSKQRIEESGLADRVELYEGDARDMSYEDNKFDAVYMAATLELFDTPDIPRVLHEIKRVLKPEGRFVAVSLSKEGHEGSISLRIYEWLHKRFPRYASCRPIYVEQSIRDAGYEIIQTDELVLGSLMPMKIVVAMPI
jgi:demethylmenaquinone methyltransferase/2-methoxy-6-polyprenyl-1,4-benzoquinol methylase